MGAHPISCPRTGLLARHGFVSERAWVQVRRDVVGPKGRVVPQQWLANTTAPGVAPEDRCRLYLVVCGAAPNGVALCCDAALVSALTRIGRPSSAEAGPAPARASKRGQRPLERRGPTVRINSSGSRGAARRRPCAQQLRRAGRAAGGAFRLSRSSVLSAAVLGAWSLLLCAWPVGKQGPR